jgi:hypothetical protein
MRYATREQGYHDTTERETELRDRLEQETGTARRQELLKLLWKLAQQKERANRAVSADKSTPRSNSLRDSTRSTSGRNASLSTSC